VHDYLDKVHHRDYITNYKIEFIQPKSKGRRLKK